MKPFLAVGFLGLCLARLPSPIRADPEPQNFEAFVAELDNKYARTRLKAVQALGHLGSAGKEAIPTLAKALHDLDEDVRQAAARALAQIGPAAVPVLVQELKHPVFQFSRRAAYGLALMGPEAAEAVPALIPCLKLGAPDVRALAAHALGEIGPPAAKAATALTLLLDDPSKEVTKQAQGALARIGRPAVPALHGALSSTNPAIRRQAAELLALRGNEAGMAVPDLIALLKDKQASVRRSAALALGAVGKAAGEAAESLIPLTKDHDQHVRAAAASALGDISTDAGMVGATLIRLFRDPVPSVQIQAALAIVKFGPAHVPLLIDAIPNKDRSTHQLAIFSLGAIGPAAKAAVPTLVDQLQDSAAAIRASAAVALARIGPDFAGKATPQLKRLVKEETETDVRLCVRLALVQLQPDNHDAVKEMTREALSGNKSRLKSAMLRPKTPAEIQRQTKTNGVLNFYVVRNSFRFGDGLDKWSHSVLESLGVDAIPAMVDTLNRENLAGGNQGFVHQGMAVGQMPQPGPLSVFFK